MNTAIKTSEFHDQPLEFRRYEELLRALSNCKLNTLPYDQKDHISKVFEVTIGFTRLGKRPKPLINSKTIRTCLTDDKKL